MPAQSWAALSSPSPCGMDGTGRRRWGDVFFGGGGCEGNAFLAMDGTGQHKMKKEFGRGLVTSGIVWPYSLCCSTIGGQLDGWEPYIGWSGNRMEPLSRRRRPEGNQKPVNSVIKQLASGSCKKLGGLLPPPGCVQAVLVADKLWADFDDRI